MCNHHILLLLLQNFIVEQRRSFEKKLVLHCIGDNGADHGQIFAGVGGICRC